MAKWWFTLGSHPFDGIETQCHNPLILSHTAKASGVWFSFFLFATSSRQSLFALLFHVVGQGFSPMSKWVCGTKMRDCLTNGDWDFLWPTSKTCVNCGTAWFQRSLLCGWPTFGMHRCYVHVFGSPPPCKIEHRHEHCICTAPWKRSANRVFGETCREQSKSHGFRHVANDIDDLLVLNVGNEGMIHNNY